MYCLKSSPVSAPSCRRMSSRSCSKLLAPACRCLLSSPALSCAEEGGRPPQCPAGFAPRSPAASSRKSNCALLRPSPRPLRIYPLPAPRRAVFAFLAELSRSSRGSRRLRSLAPPSDISPPRSPLPRSPRGFIDLPRGRLDLTRAPGPAHGWAVRVAGPHLTRLPMLEQASRTGSPSSRRAPSRLPLACAAGGVGPPLSRANSPSSPDPPFPSIQRSVGTEREGRSRAGRRHLQRPAAAGILQLKCQV